MTYRSGHQNFITEVGKKPPIRRFICTDGSCRTCNELRSGEFAPPHDASASCLSGRRAHCTCDTCF